MVRLVCLCKYPLFSKHHPGFPFWQIPVGDHLETLIHQECRFLANRHLEYEIKVIHNYSGVTYAILMIFFFCSCSFCLQMLVWRTLIPALYSSCRRRQMTSVARKPGIAGVYSEMEASAQSDVCLINESQRSGWINCRKKEGRFKNSL